MELNVQTRSHIKHLLQHVLVDFLEAGLPSFEVEAGLARSDRGRTIIVPELLGEMKVGATANKLFKDQHASSHSRSIHIHQRLRVNVRTDQDDFARLTHNTLGPE